MTPWEQVKILSRKLGFPVRDTLPENPEIDVTSRLPADFFTRHRIVPFIDPSLKNFPVAVANPLIVMPLDLLSAEIHRPFCVVVAPEAEIDRLLILRSRRLMRSVSEVLETRHADPGVDDSVLQQELTIEGSDDSVAVRLVNAMIAEAVERRASDIHIEPGSDGVRIRYRIDGMLQDGYSSPGHLKEQVVSRIKIMSRLDITVRHKPQDGGMSVLIGGHPVDIRVSAVPTPQGERLVLRILGRESVRTDLNALGMPQTLIGDLDRLLRQNQGLILCSGPTGSGKTTTLYACMERIDTRTRNTITVEDPVEIQIKGVSQIQTGGPSGLSFAAALRSILRQDPDVIMVGEIRDPETAGLAFRAGQTGHLVLSSVHTFDPVGAVLRLMDLGVDPALIAETLTVVVDQRLIRLKCPDCHPGTPESKNSSTPCGTCLGTGFHGRTGLFRKMPVDDGLRDLIRRKDIPALRKSGTALYESTFRETARALIETGQTTSEEVIRVIEEQEPV